MGGTLDRDAEAPVTWREGSVRLIAAADAPVRVEPWLFDPGELDNRDLLKGTSSGRSTAWFFDHDGVSLVLRHYWRGGLIGKLNRDRYLWSGLARSRPYRELTILSRLRAERLPVPRPVGARILRRGATYQADLVTVAIPGTRTFADAILEGTLDGAAWVEVGRTVRRFHDAGAHHADLNVRNILLDESGAVWLIDWDRGRLRGPSGGWVRWRSRTLARLHRSLSKEPDLAAATDAHWTTLLRAYEAG